MTLYVLDSDIVSLYQDGDPLVVRRVQEHDSAEVAVTVITVDEHVSAWYTLIRRAKNRPQLAFAYAKLGAAVTFLGQMTILPFTEDAMETFEWLKKAKLRVRANDLRIASIVYLNDMTLVTRNIRDFENIPHLRIENWAD